MLQSLPVRLLVSLVFTTLVGSSLEEGPRAQEPTRVPPVSGVLVDIGTRRLHLNCTGSGSPAVIIENGGGAFSVDWALVQPAVSRLTTICTYDRAGYAWSEPGAVRDLPDQVNVDFELLLQSGHVAPPYVLVGQSIGAIMIRDYQRRNPQKVAGMVFVDPTHDEGLAYMIDGKPKAISLTTRQELHQFMQTLMAKAPSPSVISEKVSAPYDGLPADVQKVRLWAEQRYAAETDRNQTPYIGEGQRQQFTALRQQRLSVPHPLGDMPLVVITNGVNKQKAQLQALSSSGQLVVAENSCHETMCAVLELSSRRSARSLLRLAVRGRSSHPDARSRRTRPYPAFVGETPRQFRVGQKETAPTGVPAGPFRVSLGGLQRVANFRHQSRTKRTHESRRLQRVRCDRPELSRSQCPTVALTQSDPLLRDRGDGRHCSRDDW